MGGVNRVQRLRLAPACQGRRRVHVYLLDEYLVTALVPSEMACFDSSPGRMRRTEVWISRDEMVLFLLYDASLDASVAT